MSVLTESRPARSVGVLVLSLVAVAVVALVGALSVQDTASRYQGLELPGWAPPSWLFGPVWTVLYVLIAISGWLVWQRAGWTRALVPYGIQLGLNAVWTPLFFAAGARGWALVEIVVLWLAIGWTVVSFARIRPLAAVLLLPYWAWTSFAAVLNATIWMMNR